MPRRHPPRGRRGLLLLCAAGAGLGAGCTDSSAAPTVVSVTPSAAYNDGAVRLTIETRGVRPVLDIDLGHARLSTPIGSTFQLVPQSGVARDLATLANVEWLAEDAFAGDARSRLTEGTYDVRVINPDGRSATSPHAFTSLGKDVFPPHLTLLDPPDGSFLHAGQVVTASVALDDGFGQITTPVWSTEYRALGTVTSQPCTLGQRPTTPDGRQVWLATFTVPTPPEGAPTAGFHFSVTVEDGGGNSGHLEADFIAVRRPAIVEFAPTRGGTAGGQAFTLRGTGLVPGARVWFDSTEATDATVMEAPAAVGGAVGTVMMGHVPAHARAETVALSVETPGGRTAARDGFVYLAAPRIRGIEPAVAPARGGIRVTVKGSDFREHTRVFMGTWPDDKRELLDCVTLALPDKMTGDLVPGVGTVRVWAEDPETGSGLAPPETIALTFLDDAPGALTPIAPASSDACPPASP